ncbi:hypothetical protein BH09MYX1_BH09MYX1_09210 [soil metagenome]
MGAIGDGTKMADPLEARLPLGPPPSAAPLFVAIAIGATAIAAIPWTLWAIVPAVVAIAGALLLLRRHRDHKRAQPFLTIHSWGISRADAQGTLRIAAWTEPFGVTVLADHARERVLLAFTTVHQTRFVGVRVAGIAGDRLLDGAATVADSDALSIHATIDASLSTLDALTLLDLVRQRVPQALRRILLSGARGERVVLDERELRVEWSQDGTTRPRRSFDLTSPIEWRGFLFHEASGPVATIYQATWVRQGPSEIVLVAQLPPEIARYGVGLGTRVDRTAVVRDLRLMQSLPGDPPPRDLRLAIERVFMLPLRQALDGAPRISWNAEPVKRTSSPDLGA